MRPTAVLLIATMLLTSSCAGVRPRSGDLVTEDKPESRAAGASLAGGLLSLFSLTALVIGATQVKDKSARAWIWSGIGTMLLAGLALQGAERGKEGGERRARRDPLDGRHVSAGGATH